jgi:sugar phosphate isomerase/epimerase
MKIACSTSIYKKKSLDEALKNVSGLGFKYVDLIAISNFGHIEPEALVRNFDKESENVRRLLDKYDLTPAAMNFAVPHPHQRDEENRTKRLERTEAAARLMKLLGIGTASFYPGYKADYRPWEDVLSDSVKSYKEMIEIGKKYGVTLTVELHAETPFQTIEQCTRLFLEMPKLFITLDISHFVCQNIDIRLTEPFMARVMNAHVRNAAPGRMQEHFPKGTVDFDWWINKLKDKYGYDGNLTVEYLQSDNENFEPDILLTRKKIEEILGH